MLSTVDWTGGFTINPDVKGSIFSLWRVFDKSEDENGISLIDNNVFHLCLTKVKKVVVYAECLKMKSALVLKYLKSAPKRRGVTRLHPCQVGISRTSMGRQPATRWDSSVIRLGGSSNRQGERVSSSNSSRKLHSA
jgi:hypothetical protein